MFIGIALCVLLALWLPYGIGYGKRTFKNSKAAALAPFVMELLALLTVILMWSRLN